MKRTLEFDSIFMKRTLEDNVEYYSPPSPRVSPPSPAISRYLMMNGHLIAGLSKSNYYTFHYIETFDPYDDEPFPYEDETYEMKPTNHQRPQWCYNILVFRVYQEHMVFCPSKSQLENYNLEDDFCQDIPIKRGPHGIAMVME